MEVLNLAKYIKLLYINKYNQEIDEMKLHKLIYLCQRESILLRGKIIFQDTLKAWDYGPVSIKVRKNFKDKNINFNENFDMDKEEKYIVNNVFEQYSHYNSIKLSILSHKENSWKKARNYIGNKIRIEDIFEDAKRVRAYDSDWDMYYDEFEDLI